MAALTQAVDLTPTLAEVFGLPVFGCHGHSLAPLLHGNGKPVREYACAVQVGGAIEWCMRTPDWALLLPLQLLTTPAVGHSGTSNRMTGGK